MVVPRKLYTVVAQQSGERSLFPGLFSHAVHAATKEPLFARGSVFKGSQLIFIQVLVYRYYSTYLK